jgi:hypothetical protein
MKNVKCIKARRKAMVAVLVTLTVALLFAMSISMANACTKSTFIEGKFGTNSPYVFSNIKKVGANAFFHVEVNGVYFEGPMIGTFKQSADVKVHYGSAQIVNTLPADPRDWPSGDLNVKVDRTFTGTINGAQGTLRVCMKAKGTGTIASRLGVPTQLEGTWAIISGTGELAKIRGDGTWKGPFPFPSGTTPPPMVTRYFDYKGQLWYLRSCFH